MKMTGRSDNRIVGILVIALIIGGVLLLTRKPEGTSDQPLRLNRKVSGEVKHFPIIEDRPVESRSAKRYNNTEVWNIEWNEDGLPKRIEIHRDAVES